MKWGYKLLIGLLVVGGVIFVVEIGNRLEPTCCPGSVYVMPPPGQELAPVVATPQESVLPRLVNIGSELCIPCQMMKPVIAELQKDFQDHFETVYVDISEGQQVLIQYDLHTIPAQVFYGSDGTELYHHEGIIERDAILVKWKELGYDFLTAEAMAR